ncbi:hypothetical protein [Prauserella cavernicola]|uniref:Uncharacterized protein n=1 Tax=Prauserella cavernicola TaxID=2800127 RepID=A0A934QLU9_9PSEU|nr:hypothetical protein [Prauserella cavernicola]MBK1783637.1 hypothetical protein [Prauserella cavernicola]
MTVQRRRAMPGEIGFPCGVAMGALLCLISVAAGGTGAPWVVLGVFAVGCAAVGAATTLPASAATACWCWALYAGFVVGRTAQLVFDTRTAVAAVVLPVVVLAASRLPLTTLLARRGRSHRR